MVGLRDWALHCVQGYTSCILFVLLHHWVEKEQVKAVQIHHVQLNLQPVLYFAVVIMTLTFDYTRAKLIYSVF